MLLSSPRGGYFLTRFRFLVSLRQFFFDSLVYTKVLVYTKKTFQNPRFTVDSYTVYSVSMFQLVCTKERYTIPVPRLIVSHDCALYAVTYAVTHDALHDETTQKSRNERLQRGNDGCKPTLIPI